MGCCGRQRFASSHAAGGLLRAWLRSQLRLADPGSVLLWAYLRTYPRQLSAPPLLFCQRKEKNEGFIRIRAKSKGHMP